MFAHVRSSPDATEAGIERIEADEEGLQERVNTINRAYSVAEKLSTTLQEVDDARADLEELRSKIEKVYEDSAKAQGRIEVNETVGEGYIDRLKKSAKDAEELIKKSEDAYHITTTKGLAGAFDQRAEELKKSIYLWVGMLLIALIVGGLFESKRIEALSTLTSAGHPDWGIIALHIVLSVLSVGGPLWFAWLSTK
jgi:septation ring formation regulator EzrA